MTTQLTINLGKELAYHTNRITNVFTTNDYTGELIKQYEEHVGAFYDDEIVNDFNYIYCFKKIAEQKVFDQQPCEEPLKDIHEVYTELQHIIDNRKAYSSVLKILMQHTKDGYAGATLMYDLLYTLRTDSKGFKDMALHYDRYMGLLFPVVDVIRTVYAYGRLSGLIDYYSFKENKDA